jgi:hypothetical protein
LAAGVFARRSQQPRYNPFLQVTARGFTPLMTPDLVKASVLEKCGFQPRADNTQVGAWRQHSKLGVTDGRGR